MVRFERIRERLPSLYRPEDADRSGSPLPLRADQLIEINGEAPAAGQIAPTRSGLRVTSDEPLRISSLRLAPDTVVGSLATVELYRLSDGVPLAMPGAVARLKGGLARIGVPFLERTFVVRLSRPGLVSQLVWATGRVLDQLDLEASQVMQAHWVDHADHARFSNFVRRRRVLQGVSPAMPDEAAIAGHPYIHDLARIGSLLGMLPWRDPLTQREVVESYRRRILRTVELYREGLGTVGALRRMVEIQLPVDESAAPGLKDLPFTVEEFAPLAFTTRAAEVRGPPDHIIGPLMRWNLTNQGEAPATPTIYIEGVEAEPDRIDPTNRPLIELFATAGERVRLGIAYDGEVPAGETLRIRPAYSCWIAAGDGVLRATSEPEGETPGDPAAGGPWAAMENWSGGAVTSLARAPDGSILAAVGDDGSLHRFDGEEWSPILTDLPAPRCLALDGDDLLIGTEAGLLRLPLYPADGEPYEPVPDPAALVSPAVNALLHTREGIWYAGTDQGLMALAADDALEPIALGAPGTVVLALYEDESGTIHLGTDLGAFQFQTGLDHRYWYAGGDFSDQVPDWVRIANPAEGEAEDLPTEERVYLPAVHAIRRGPDGSIWFGTDRGIARYRASSVGGAAYSVHLEAFPDLASGAVHEIAADERGALWFATDQGIFRFDQRDWWHLRNDELVRLPLGTSGPANERVPRHWRYARGQDRWEFVDPAAGALTWTAFTGDPRSEEGAAARAILWADEAVADLGHWRDDDFVPAGTPAPHPLRSRYKPDDTRCVEGGIPAIPRLPRGASTWRYLALEDESGEAPRITPAWSREGRLIPPPEDQLAVEEGRYSAPTPAPELSHFDQAAFSYDPAARVRMRWEGRRSLTVLARLQTTVAIPSLEPAVIDRVWKGIQKVRPAGVTTLLAVGETIVRGR